MEGPYWSIWRDGGDMFGCGLSSTRLDERRTLEEAIQFAQGYCETHGVSPTEVRLDEWADEDEFVISISLDEHLEMRKQAK